MRKSAERGVKVKKDGVGFLKTLYMNSLRSWYIYFWKKGDNC